MSKKTILILLCALFVSFITSAQQKFTVGSFGYMVSPGNTYADTNLKSNIGYFTGVLTVPLKLNEKTALLTGLRGNLWNVKYDPKGFWPENYYSLGLTLGVNHKFSDDNSLLLVLLPKLNSDFKVLNSNAFQLGFIGTWSHRVDEDFLWKAGLYYGAEFFGPFFSPIFGLDWKLSNKWKIKGDLPIYVNIDYNIKKDFSVGLGYIALVSTFRLSGEFQDAYTSRFAIEPYLFANAKVAKNVYLNGKLGYTMGRTYPIYAKDDKIDWQLMAWEFGDEREQLNPEIDEGLFIEFTLSYKVDI
ncbi:MAG: hypothetical protein GXO89_11135 [Chlorobi bacterium]|nr:hypothetical protein [Chlorobiota bacterium]